MDCVVSLDPAYPRALLRSPRPPASLWVRGRLPAPGERVVALVGSRASSGDGNARARALAGELVGRGFAVLSGGALGIDAAAHEGALEAGGVTFAVLGCGVDVVYPDRHLRLFQRIEAAGGLMSEYEPGTKPRPGQFPARNRIVAALADAVVVVEAAHRSGALITARLAQQMGVPLMAVPGSSGTDALLDAGSACEGASAVDVEEVIAGRRPFAGRAEVRARAEASGSPLIVALADRPIAAPALAVRLQMPLPAVMAALAEAELEGQVRRRPGGEYEVSRGN